MNLVYQVEFDFKAKTKENNTNGMMIDDDSSSQVYVSHICSNKNGVLAVSGNGFVKLYDIQTMKVRQYFGSSQKCLSDLQFSNKNQSLLCTSSHNGCIVMYDIRMNIKHNKQKKNKLLKNSCIFHSPNHKSLFSVACDENIVAGSGLNSIYLWDIRHMNSNIPLHTLSDYHSQEITRVIFNPFDVGHNDRHLLSISEDGLMNEYNLCPTQEISEPELTNVYPCNDALWNFGLFCDYGQQYAYALSNSNSLIIHRLIGIKNEFDNNSIMDETIVCSFSSSDLNNYSLIDCFYDYGQSQKLFLLSCNTSGNLRITQIPISMKTLSNNNCNNNSGITVVGEISGVHKHRIRSAHHLSDCKLIVTGDENNQLCFWKFDADLCQRQAKQSVNDELLLSQFLTSEDDHKTYCYGKAMSANGKSIASHSQYKPF